MSATILDAMTNTASGAPSGWTPSAGSNRVAFIAIVGYHYAEAIPPTSCTFGGQTMELVATADYTNVAVAVFALRETGIAAMSGNSVVPAGHDLSAWNSVYWSVSGAVQSGSFTKTEQTTTSDIAASLARVASSMTFALSAYPANDNIDFTNPADTFDGFIATAFELTYGGATDSARTVNWTATNPGAQLAGVAFNVGPSGGVSGTLGSTESGSDSFASTGTTSSLGVRLTLRDTDTGALYTSLSGLIISVRAASNSTSLLGSTTSGTTDGSGVMQFQSGSLGSIGTYVYVTVEKSDNTIVETYRVQVIDLNA